MESNNHGSRYSFPAMVARGAAQVSGARMLGIAATCAKIGVSRTFVYDHMRRGNFPQSIKLSPRRVVWRESELDAWLLSRAAA